MSSELVVSFLVVGVVVAVLSGPLWAPALEEWLAERVDDPDWVKLMEHRVGGNVAPAVVVTNGTAQADLFTVRLVGSSEYLELCKGDVTREGECYPRGDPGRVKSGERLVVMCDWEGTRELVVVYGPVGVLRGEMPCGGWG